jgi:hypothetical protein
MDRNEQFVTDRIRESETRTADIITEAKSDFGRIVTGYQEVIVSQIRTLGDVVVAECKILSERIGGHKEALDRAIGTIRNELGAFQLDMVEKVTILTTQQADAKSRKTLPSVENNKNGSVTMTVLRDVALLIAMIGTIYALLRDSFVTTRDLLVKNPPPPTANHGKP